MTKNIPFSLKQLHSLNVFVYCQGWNASKLQHTYTFLYVTQGRSQPHSPGWDAGARVPLSSFFPQISINFSYFSSNFSYFLPHFGPPGGRLAHPERPWLRHWCNNYYFPKNTDKQSKQWTHYSALKIKEFPAWFWFTTLKQNSLSSQTYLFNEKGNCVHSFYNMEVNME